MGWLVQILESIKQEINAGTICELDMESEPASYARIPRDKFAEELGLLTEALIEAVQGNTFTPLKVHISWMCKLRLEQGVRLSDIMAFFDLYETAVKDAMSIYLKE
ncbi:MAG: sasA 5, partial [Sporomusa sp.]|nr:sasA 5 [Sporomusa sp.]